MENLSTRLWLEEVDNDGKDIKSYTGEINNRCGSENKATVIAMGLTKLHKTVELPDNDATRGMIRKVRHLVKVEES